MGVEREVLLPDIGEFENVDVAEVLVSAGDRVAAEDSLIVLESDKASMEIPSPFAGVVVEMKASVGDRVSRGSLIAVIEIDESARAQSEAPEQEEAGTAPRVEPEPRDTARAEELAPQADGAAPESREATPPPAQSETAAQALEAHASPSVRRLGRELGVDLRLVPGSGRKGRIRREDVQGYVKSMIVKGTAAGVPIAGVAVAAPLRFDFSQFGPTETEPLNRIRKLSSAHLHRSWVTVPHVTQFDEADITELDTFRRAMKEEAQARGIKLTFLPFLLKACAHALQEFPHFNASLDHTGENLIVKRYYHIGVAVDTQGGLVVPVVRDADRKGLYAIAAELAELSEKARARKLQPSDLQGGSFSISSLGGIGGTFFTPIVNHPEVAILGVSRMQWKPVHQDGAFVPRLILPLSLSYDHRVVDGAAAARFTTRLAELLSDLRRLIL
ncbi:MAG: dihydrolipoyllysine-residue acetyltransferase [Myxococcales bacterium]|nr:dihydrolipoyllysine-residue acetyltransferase [Myxococcales bacterium]MDH5305604.1 dihydrolipoyllysine-residue acetyltransferase [Myxococcales bacterium]MDH5565250.1 dihydrolipoyllysine-residue acetyltransferase [Myxococcales bacterium]